ncbi:MAG: cyclic nucleotide-binding domain-containing protein [Pseudomonadota bacterium]
MSKQLEQDVEALRRVPLFAEVNTLTLKLLAFASERVSFPARQDVVRQGEHGDAAYVLIDGVAEVFTEQGGVESKVAELSGHEFVGEISILCNVPRTATVRAVTQLETLRIEKDQFFDLLENSPVVAVQMLRVLAERLAKTTADMATLRASR